MKHLTIAYNGQTLFDGEIAELIYSDLDNGVQVEGRFTKAVRETSSGPAFLDMLTTSLANASKQKTAERAAQLRAQAETDETTDTADTTEGDHQ